MFKKYNFFHYNFKLLIFTIALAVIGCIIVGSAEVTLQSRQIMGCILGFVLMLALSLFDYSLILKLYWLIYGINIVLLVMVIFLGEEANNAQRWLKILGVQFQPSELAKLLMILFFAQFIHKHEEELNTIKYISLCVILFGITAVLVLKQPDLSTTIVLTIIFCCVMFVGEIRFRVIAGALAIAVPVAVIMIYLIMQPDQTILDNYQRNRIMAFLNQEEYANDIGYQQSYSVMAIGSGQLSGKGYNNNEISSVKNSNFLAEQQTDFIFAVIGEEFGFVGTVTVIILLLLITIECFAIAIRSPYMSGKIIAAGVGIWIGFQGFINIGVTTYLLPNTGLPLPFVSYGLTSLVTNFIGIGFVLNVGLQCDEK